MIHHADLTFSILFCSSSPLKALAKLAECLRLLLNKAIRAMHQERFAVLQARPSERCRGRLGPAKWLQAQNARHTHGCRRAAHDAGV